MIKKITLVLSTAALVLGASSCNKTKSTSKKFLKAGEWQVTELSVDGVNEDELPMWEIEGCDIYEESCFGEWKNDEGGHAEFVWQFRDKAETFEISYQAGEEDHDHGNSHDHDHAAEEAAEQAYEFSGVYDVVETSKTSMEFTSTNTVGYPNSTVVIKIEKK